MKHAPVASKRRVNLLLDADTLDAARSLGLNLSQIASRGLAAEVRDEQQRRWKQENADWIAAHRRWVEDNELPLERYRLF